MNTEYKNDEFRPVMFRMQAGGSEFTPSPTNSLNFNFSLI